MTSTSTNSFAISICCLCIASGCSLGSNREESPRTVVQVDREGLQPQMNSEEVDEAYRRAYAEGLRLVSTNQYGLAIGAFQTAVELRGDSPEALFNLGACHEAIGDPLQAINFYRRALDISPYDADCYRNLGTSFIKLYYRDRSPSLRKMAQDAWNHSLDLRPDQPEVRQFLARSDKLD